MKNFFAVFDGYKISQSTLAYAQQMAGNANARLVGVFLDDFFYHTYNLAKTYATAENPDDRIKELNEKDQIKRDEAVALFQSSCETARVDYAIHRHNSIALQELKLESMFADLIIINESENFSQVREQVPSRFMKDLLADVQCPVMVVPSTYIAIDKIVLLYNGDPSAVYAVKMFNYLLNHFKALPVEVLTVKPSKTDLNLPNPAPMEEFIRTHFPEARITVTQGDAEEEIVAYLRRGKENELVVLGAYRRSELSRWFKTSMADILMRELDTPLFIAHST